MKKTSREDVTRHEYVNNVHVLTEVMKNRVIYTDAAGVEYISYVKGRRKITREGAKAVWHHYCKLVEPINMSQIIARLKGEAVGVHDRNTDQK